MGDWGHNLKFTLDIGFGDKEQWKKGSKSNFRGSFNAYTKYYGKI